MGTNKRQQSGRPATVRDYPLRGKVFCGECKSPMSISTSQIHGRRALNLRVAYDSRIADVYYFTEAFAYLKELIRNPSLLEGAPETVFDDIF